MKLCPQCDLRYPDVCDFCKHYEFNGDEEGKYTGNGYCKFHMKLMDPGDGCEDFYCNDYDNFLLNIENLKKND